MHACMPTYLHTNIRRWPLVAVRLVACSWHATLHDRIAQVSHPLNPNEWVKTERALCHACKLGICLRPETTWETSGHQLRRF